MPLQAIIPPQSFELVRNRVAEILAVNMAEQHDLDSNFVAPTVYVERFYPFNADTELPAINVTFNSGKYENGNIKKDEGDYIINIDVYTNAPTTPEIKGDKAAMLSMNKIVGMCRAILMNPMYLTLGYATPTFVIGRTIQKIFIADKSVVEDALSNVVGRIQLQVKAIEFTELVDGVPLELAGTTVKLKDSENGFYYEYEN